MFDGFVVSMGLRRAMRSTTGSAATAGAAAGSSARTQTTSTVDSRAIRRRGCWIIWGKSSWEPTNRSSTVPSAVPIPIGKRAERRTRPESP